jgi:hypothetical protein
LLTHIAYNSAMPLQAEERLFIEAMRDLNQQASRMQEEEKKDSVETNGLLTNIATSLIFEGKHLVVFDDKETR